MLPCVRRAEPYIAGGIGHFHRGMQIGNGTYILRPCFQHARRCSHIAFQYLVRTVDRRNTERPVFRKRHPFIPGFCLQFFAYELRNLLFVGKIMLPVLHLRQTDHITEFLPELRFNGSYADILPVFRGIHIIIMSAAAKRRIPRHPASHNAGQGNYLHAQRRVIQAHVNALPFSRPFSRQQRHGNGCCGIKGAADGRNLNLADGHLSAVV